MEKLCSKLAFYECMILLFVFEKAYITKKDVLTYTIKEEKKFILKIEILFLIFTSFLFLYFSEDRETYLSGLIFLAGGCFLGIISCVFFIWNFKIFLKTTCDASGLLFWNRPLTGPGTFLYFDNNQNTEKSFSSRKQANQFACLGSQIKKPPIKAVF